MASACVNNSIGSYTWLTPTPRLSFSRENDSSSKPDHPDSPDPADFEFCLEDPVAMLPADQLFSDGKLVPLHVTTLRPTTSPSSSNAVRVKSSSTGGGGGVGDESSGSAPAAVKPCDDISGMAMDSYLFSPKAPRCSSRWRELLGFRRLSQSQNGTITSTAASQHQSKNSKSSSIKHFLHRNSTKSSSSSSSTSSSFSLDSSLSLPLLKDSDSESVSISSSRLSLSSSSSGHEHEDLPRLSLDSDKPNPNPFANPVRMRMVRPNQTGSTTSRVGRSPIRRDTSSRGVSVDSPRLNSSGKIVFQSLERSSSSPSSFNGSSGGQRFKQRGMERSYSANVRVTPVLNVPVCSLRGSSKSGSVFGFFSSSPQKTGAGTTTRQVQINNCRNRTTDRT